MRQTISIGYSVLVFSVQGFSVQEGTPSLAKECIRMLNGLEKALEKHLPESERRWIMDEE
jgi:hypothetical protein